MPDDRPAAGHADSDGADPPLPGLRRAHDHEPALRRYVLQDAGWYAAQRRFDDFLCAHGHSELLLLELGVGFNTPGIIKLPFWRMAAENPHVTYACLNMGEALCPDEIGDRSICIDCDLREALEDLST